MTLQKTNQSQWTSACSPSAPPTCGKNENISLDLHLAVPTLLSACIRLTSTNWREEVKRSITLACMIVCVCPLGLSSQINQKCFEQHNKPSKAVHPRFVQWKWSTELRTIPQSKHVVHPNIVTDYKLYSYVIVLPQLLMFLHSTPCLPLLTGELQLQLQGAQPLLTPPTSHSDTTPPVTLHPTPTPTPNQDVHSCWSSYRWDKNYIECPKPTEGFRAVVFQLCIDTRPITALKHTLRQFSLLCQEERVRGGFLQFQCRT